MHISTLDWFISIYFPSRTAPEHYQMLNVIYLLYIFDKNYLLLFFNFRWIEPGLVLVAIPKEHSSIVLEAAKKA